MTTETADDDKPEANPDHPARSRNLALAHLIAATYSRVGELAGATCGDLILDSRDGRVIGMAIRPSKPGYVRYVGYDDAHTGHTDARDALAAWLQQLSTLHARPLQPGDPLFPSLRPGGGLDRPATPTALAAALRRTPSLLDGVPAGARSLRRGGITRTLQGRSAQFVATIARHRSLDRLGLYLTRPEDPETPAV